jgi:hypothetical protein
MQGHWLSTPSWLGAYGVLETLWLAVHGMLDVGTGSTTHYALGMHLDREVPLSEASSIPCCKHYSRDSMSVEIARVRPSLFWCFP